MRRLDWLLLAVIAVFLTCALAAQTLGGAFTGAGNETLVERLVSPCSDSPISGQCPTISLRRH
jgi:hypothetical protein